MTRAQYFKFAMLLSLAGSLFSGYLSAVRFFSKSCVFSEPCPMFLGQPACYFGFAFFLLLLIVSIIEVVKKDASKGLVKISMSLAFVGAIFAAYFALIEFSQYKGIATEGFPVNGLGISTCTYGAVFFVSILAVYFRIYQFTAKEI